MVTLASLSGALLLVIPGVGVAGLFFWSAVILWRQRDTPVLSRIAAVLFALVGCACLLASFILGACAYQPIRIGG